MGLSELLAIGAAIIAVCAGVCVAAVALIRMRPARRRAKPAPVVEGEYMTFVGSWTLTVSHEQNIGRRAQQQDAYSIVLDAGRVTAVVCDGMGGMSMGAEAAQTAVGVIMPCLEQAQGSVEEQMLYAVNRANERVFELCGGTGGATVVLIRVDAQGLRYVSAGDSHLYLLREGRLEQLGQDHIFYFDLLKHAQSGVITMQEACEHPEREHLTSFLGKELLSKVNATDTPLPLQAGDAILACTDGVYRALPDDELIRLVENGDAKGVIAAVLAKNAPKQDNCTAVLIKVRESR